MKFGKLLTKTIGLSVPSWTPKWIDYKQLKKLLHPLEDGKRVPHDENSSSTRGLQHGDALASLLVQYAEGNETEVAFFSALQEELIKVAEFYEEVESTLALRYITVMGVFRGYVLREKNSQEISKSTNPHMSNDDSATVVANLVSREEVVHLMEQIVQFYMQLLQLENFAVINVCGFTKILKKHDKITGYSIKLHFLNRTLSKQKFAHHYKLIRMLNGTERAYHYLSARQPEHLRGTMEKADATRLADLRDIKQTAIAHHSETNGAELHVHSGRKRTRDDGDAGYNRNGEGDMDEYKSDRVTRARSSSEIELAKLLCNAGLPDASGAGAI